MSPLSTSKAGIAGGRGILEKAKGNSPRRLGATLAYLKKEGREEKGERGGQGNHRKEERTQLLSHGVL